MLKFILQGNSKKTVGRITHRTTARTAEFIPCESPPEVKTAMLRPEYIFGWMSAWESHLPHPDWNMKRFSLFGCGHRTAGKPYRKGKGQYV
jgi:hypothetical protein